MNARPPSESLRPRERARAGRRKSPIENTSGFFRVEFEIISECADRKHGEFFLVENLQHLHQAAGGDRREFQFPILDTGIDEIRTEVTGIY